MKPIVILENIRSAYNVGNIIRTADALGYDVVLSGFSPSPKDNLSVKKTSLDAEENVNLQQFWHTQEAITYVKEQGYVLVAAEIIQGRSIVLGQHVINGVVAVVLGNENTGVLQETLEQVDHILHIPMEGIKESLNVGQAGAIMMWEFTK